MSPLYAPEASAEYDEHDDPADVPALGGDPEAEAQLLEIHRLIELLPAERRPPWRACVASWATRGINLKTVISAVGLELPELAPGPAPAAAIELAAIVASFADVPATVAPATVPKPDPVAPVTPVTPVDSAPESVAPVDSAPIKAARKSRAPAVVAGPNDRPGRSHVPSTGYFPVDNAVVDKLLDVMPETALKAYLFAWKLARRKDGVFYFAHQTVAEKMGLKNRDSGRRAMSLLMRAGLVQVVNRGHGGGRGGAAANVANTYRLTAIETLDIAEVRAVLAEGVG